MYPTGRFRTIFAGAALLALLFAQQQQLITLPGQGRIQSALPDALHGPWFAIVTWLIALFVNRRVLKRRVQGRSTIWLTALLGAGLAVGTEVLQWFTGGDAEVGDVVRDLTGMSAALCIWAARTRQMQFRPAVGIAVLLLGLSQYPLVHALLVDRYRDSIAPELLGFDSPFARELITSSNSTIGFVAAPAAWRAIHPVLRIALGDDTYPGIHLDDPVSDWRAYAALAVDAYVEGDQPLPITISVRLDNAPVDHVYHTFNCAPGACSIVWPLAGLFDRDVARINAVVIHSTGDHAGRVVYLGRVALEK